MALLILISQHWYHCWDVNWVLSCKLILIRGLRYAFSILFLQFQQVIDHDWRSIEAFCIQFWWSNQMGTFSHTTPLILLEEFILSSNANCFCLEGNCYYEKGQMSTGHRIWAKNGPLRGGTTTWQNTNHFSPLSAITDIQNISHFYSNPNWISLWDSRVRCSKGEEDLPSRKVSSIWKLAFACMHLFSNSVVISFCTILSEILSLL